MSAGDILEELTLSRREDARRREEKVPFEKMLCMARSAPEPRDFAAALAAPGASVIAELKRASPSEGMIREDFRPGALAAELEAAGAAALSVLCEPHRFLGSEDYLREARSCVRLPVLYKDFISSEYQIAAARAAGADAVLLIAAVLDDAALAGLLGFARSLGIEALVETHDGNEIRRACATGAKIIGVNCRDLRNFHTDTALLEKLVGAIPGGRIRVAESGMHDAAAVAAAQAAGADAFLIGTALMRAPSPGLKLKELTEDR